jgi:septal ring factor EnvC (AmiA/AmiB activator)
MQTQSNCKSLSSLQKTVKEYEFKIRTLQFDLSNSQKDFQKVMKKMNKMYYMISKLDRETKLYGKLRRNLLVFRNQ